MPPDLSIRGLSKSYKGGLQALKHIDLDIQRGEIFALLGPNGAGKSTLINAVCGIVSPSTGTVLVGGHDAQKEYRAARSMIGLVPQEMHIDMFETVWAVTNYSRGLFGLPPNPGHVEQVLKDLSLWEKKDSKLMTLSGGMKRNNRPLQKINVKIKPEIVTIKREVDISLGAGTHVKPADWNAIIADPDTILLYTRNDYEFMNGTFRGAINPQTVKFSDLPNFVAENLDPDRHKRIAMFCTGGIRCEKFAPYMKGLGFEEMYQLEGGILRYIEETPTDETMWEGECFVFDERRTLDSSLKQGTGPDYSQRGFLIRNPERNSS